MMYATILCCKPRSRKVVSEIIMWRQGLKFSHVVMSVGDRRLDLRKVYEAKAPKVTMSWINRFMESHQVVEAYVIPLPPTTLVAAERRAIMALQTPYGFLGLIGHLVAMITGRFPRWAMDGSKAEYCVEYLVRVLGISEIDADTADLVIFREWLRKNGRLIPLEAVENLNAS